MIPFQMEKAAATGSRFYLRNRIDYNANNGSRNAFPGPGTGSVETEVRHRCCKATALNSTGSTAPAANWVSRTA